MSEIVIKVSDELLSFVYRNGFVPSEKRDELNRAILECVELPKGHGELKDAKQICQKIISKLGIKDAGFLLPAEKEVFRVIEETEALVEADKGE